MPLYKFIWSILIGIFLSSCSMFANEPTYSLQQPLIKTESIVAMPLATYNARLAYIAEGNGGLFLCMVESNSQLSRCKITGVTTGGSIPKWLPNNIAFHKINGVEYAYVASNASVFMCNVNLDNNLSNCHTTGSQTNNEELNWLPTELKFAVIGNTTYAYITAVKRVYLCKINSDGNLSNCVTTGSNVMQQVMFWLPNGITFNRLNGHSYAYIAGAKNLFQCQIDGGGNLINCHQTGVDSATSKIRWHPNNVTFARQGSGFYAYVADPNHLYQCNVDNDGGLLNCNPTGTDSSGSYPHWLANNVVFNFAGSKKYAYVVGVYNAYLCEVGNTNAGALSNCVVTGSSTNGTVLTWNPSNITLKE